MRAALGLALLLPGCGGTAAAPPETVLERGLWKTETYYKTPVVDGESIDALRRDLPADSEKTACETPQMRSGPDFLRRANLRQDVCTLEQSSIADGNLSATGECPSLARKLARNMNAGGMPVENAEAKVSFDGTYDPRYVRIDGKIGVAATTAQGETSRLTIESTHKAERIGDCP